MRLQEFASAEEQMALWRLVSDSVWTSISQQAHQERQERAAKAAQNKTKRKHATRASGKSSSTPVPINMTKVPHNKVVKMVAPTAPTAPTAANTAPVGNAVANASTSGMYRNGRNVNATDKIAANSSVAMTPAAAAQISSVSSPTQSATPIVPAPAAHGTQKASSGSQDAFNWRNTSVHKKLPAATDRHSTNAYRNQTVQPSARGAITR